MHTYLDNTILIPYVYTVYTYMYYITSKHIFWDIYFGHSFMEIQSNSINNGHKSINQIYPDSLGGSTRPCSTCHTWGVSAEQRQTWKLFFALDIEKDSNNQQGEMLTLIHS